MNNARSNRSADPCKIVAMVQQRIHKGATPMARRRVADETCRLVDHNQISVLMQNIQRDRLGENFKLNRLWGCGLDTRSKNQLPTRTTQKLTVQLDASRLNPTSNLRPGRCTKRGKPKVSPTARVLVNAMVCRSESEFKLYAPAG